MFYLVIIKKSLVAPRTLIFHFFKFPIFIKILLFFLTLLLRYSIQGAKFKIASHLLL